MTVKSNYIIKICLLGEANVGKTSLVYQFIEKKFRGNYKSTLGVNLLKKDINVKEFGDVSAQIWDLGGQESFRSLRKLYLEGANGALIIYDCTKRNSYEKLEDWILDFKDARGNKPLLLIGNKSDLTDAVKVQESEGIELAKRHNMEFMPTSAKTGSNVESAFMDIIKKILNKSLDS
ncbi:MAG: GTP-binding protein [Candidatus Lokiarchaeota archaeon]|nr:GTP-binding protein [Candidatus Lokiarchaeota archaeon]